MRPSDTSHEVRSVSTAREYAEAGAPEYWIIDPQTETIGVLWPQGFSVALDAHQLN
jgi:Uma2 family endonuclease